MTVVVGCQQMVHGQLHKCREHVSCQEHMQCSLLGTSTLPQHYFSGNFWAFGHLLEDRSLRERSATTILWQWCGKGVYWGSWHLWITGDSMGISSAEKLGGRMTPVRSCGMIRGEHMSRCRLLGSRTDQHISFMLHFLSYSCSSPTFVKGGPVK